MTRPAVVVLAGLLVLSAGACGVSGQDRPRPVERTSIQQAPGLPSVATRPRDTSTSPASTTSVTTTTTLPQPSPGR